MDGWDGGYVPKAELSDDERVMSERARELRIFFDQCQGQDGGARLIEEAIAAYGRDQDIIERAEKLAQAVLKMPIHSLDEQARNLLAAMGRK